MIFFLFLGLFMKKRLMVVNVGFWNNVVFVIGDLFFIIVIGCRYSG